MVVLILFGLPPNSPLGDRAGRPSESPASRSASRPDIWYVTARNNLNATSTSPLWSFTTGDVPPLPNFSVSLPSGPATWHPSVLRTRSTYPVQGGDDPGNGISTTVARWWTTTDRNPMFTYAAAGNYTVCRLVVGDGPARKPQGT